jgi:predicted nucleic acid-binding protein
VRVYLDTSIIIPLLVQDAWSARADAWVLRALPDIVLSDYASAEFASALARRVRTKEISSAEARAAFVTLDEWAARVSERIEIRTADVRTAESFLRRLDLTLRAPDAIHIALAQRARAALATFDEKMAAAAGALRVELAAP